MLDPLLQLLRGSCGYGSHTLDGLSVPFGLNAGLLQDNLQSSNSIDFDGNIIFRRLRIRLGGL